MSYFRMPSVSARQPQDLDPSIMFHLTSHFVNRVHGAPPPSLLLDHFNQINARYIL